ncbi:MAG TPA: hypothetical protein DC042_03000 [Bacteroidales bacterium]|nr:hypothetical protein [Bacteroidales bacterium]
MLQPYNIERVTSAITGSSTFGGIVTNSVLSSYVPARRTVVFVEARGYETARREQIVNTKNYQFNFG